MGVTKLWEVLKDIKQEKHIEELEGQVWAVDLATWVCEAECVKAMHNSVQRPYLRNLLFRVNGLLKAGIKLVFVIDGKPPEVKLNTIAKRLGSSGDRTRKNPSSRGARNRLNAKFSECCILLDSLGIPWLKAEGEAEALCATLNKHGLVDAVVTSDGDAFLYGARTVYRNFSIDRKDTTIECYQMDDIEMKLGMNRHNMIALGLLLGCDYAPKGVVGIGVTQAVKLLSSWKSQDPLEIFKQWKREGNISNAVQHGKKPPHCSTCGHHGLKRDHSKSGCSTCGRACAAASKFGQPIIVLECMCQWHKTEAKKKESATEDKVRTLALKDPNFPPLEVVNEFLKEQRYAGQRGNLEEVKPRLVARSLTLDISCKYLMGKLDWGTTYALSKVLPILTRYILELKTSERNVNAIEEELPSNDTKQIEIQEILKTKVKDGVQSLEVKWFFLATVDIETAENYEPITVESESIVKKAFPLVVEEFYDKVEKGKEDKKRVKLEAQKLERKMKREVKLKAQASSSKTVPVGKKMTDFFAAKKQKNKQGAFDASSKISAHEQDQALKSIQSLGESLASLTIENRNKSDRITPEIGKTDTITLEIGNESNAKAKSARTKYNEKSYNANYVVSSKLANESKKDIKSTYVMVFSSDSECSDVESDDVLKICDVGNSIDNAEKEKYKKRHGTSSTVSPSSYVENNGGYLSSASSVLFTPSRNEITFSNDLNFSLSSSLLRTPKPLSDTPVPDSIVNYPGNLENSLRPHKQPLNDLNSLNLPSLEIEEPKTPQRNFLKENCNPTSVHSPVYMTLMDRLKARRASSTCE